MLALHVLDLSGRSRSTGVQLHAWLSSLSRLRVHTCGMATCKPFQHCLPLYPQDICAILCGLVIAQDYR